MVDVVYADDTSSAPVLQWKCCGVSGYADWHEALQEKVVPDRCCQEHYQECGRNATNQFWTQVRGAVRLMIFGRFLSYFIQHFPFHDLNSWEVYDVHS